MFCFFVYNESIQSLNFNNNLKDRNESCQRQIRQMRTTSGHSKRMGYLCKGSIKRQMRTTSGHSQRMGYLQGEHKETHININLTQTQLQGSIQLLNCSDVRIWRFVWMCIRCFSCWQGFPQSYTDVPACAKLWQSYPSLQQHGQVCLAFLYLFLCWSYSFAAFIQKKKQKHAHHQLQTHARQRLKYWSGYKLIL